MITRFLHANRSATRSYIRLAHRGKGLKAEVGILASLLAEQKAREIAADLPDYLNYETLWGHLETLAPV